MDKGLILIMYALASGGMLCLVLGANTIEAAKTALRSRPFVYLTAGAAAAGVLTCLANYLLTSAIDVQHVSIITSAPLSIGWIILIAVYCGEHGTRARSSKRELREQHADPTKRDRMPGNDPRVH